MKTRMAKICMVSLILVIDVLIFFIYTKYSLEYALHHNLWLVVILQIFVVLNIVCNFLPIKWLLDNTGLYRVNREYIFIVVILLISFIELRSYIIGTNKFGQTCIGSSVWMCDDLKK